MQMMEGMQSMMLGMGLFWLLIVLVLILAAAYLVKRLFFDRSRKGSDDQGRSSD